MTVSLHSSSFFNTNCYTNIVKQCLREHTIHIQYVYCIECTIVFSSVLTISMSEESYSVSESEGLVRVCVELEGEVRLSDGQMVQVLFFTQGNTATQNGEERCMYNGSFNFFA